MLVLRGGIFPGGVFLRIVDWFVTSFVELIATNLVVSDDSYDVDIYVIKEGIEDSSGGIGLWFQSLSRQSSIKERDCLIFSSDEIKSIGNRIEEEIGFSSMKSIFRIKIPNYLRRNSVKKIFAKFGYDAEEIYNLFFIFKLIKFVNFLSRNEILIRRIIVPIYGGFGYYLPRNWPVHVALISGTSHAIRDMEIPTKRLKRHFQPKLRKEELLLRKFKDRIAISDFIVSEYLNYRQDEKFTVCHPRIRDPLSMNHGGVEFGLLRWEERQDVILYLGRMESRKGFDILLSAWSISGLAQRGFKLFMCGELGSEIPNDFKKTLGVEFKGKISQSDKDKFLKTAKIVVVPSRFESFGIVVIEALARGTPVLVSRNSGLEYISSMTETIKSFASLNVEECALKMVEMVESESSWQRLSSSSRKEFQRLFLLE